MKKKPLLYPMNDVLTSRVDGIMTRSKRMLSNEHRLIPTLIYVKEGVEFSIPMTYDTFTSAGRAMLANPYRATEFMGRMGVAYGHFAMDLAQRSFNPEFAEEDSAHFFPSIECLMTHIGPQSLVVVSPIKQVTAGNFGEVLLNMLLGPDSPRAKPAIMVVGRSPIRVHCQIADITVTKSGALRFHKPKIVDSFLGHKEIFGLFSSVFIPNPN